MNDLSVSPVEAADSTVIDTEVTVAPSGGGQVAPPSDDPNAIFRENLAKVKEMGDSGDDDDELPEPDKPAKPEKSEAKAEEPEADKDTKPAKERRPDGKFAAKVEAEPEAKEEPKPDWVDEEEWQKIKTPPERLLPDAKEKWAAVPRSVKRDVIAWMGEVEAEREQTREANERYELIRQYDDMARANGRAGVHESLQQVAQLEQLMSTNPLLAINQILQQAGPRKADGSAITLQELANHVVGMGHEGYTRALQQGQQQAALTQEQQRIQAVMAENEALREKAANYEINVNVIEPFRRAHPRFDELRDETRLWAEHLSRDPVHGKQFNSLSLQDQLAAAYERAERYNPPSTPASQPSSGLDQIDRVANDFSGNKSIRTRPGAATPPEDGAEGKSLDEILADNLRKVRR